MENNCVCPGFPFGWVLFALALMLAGTRWGVRDAQLQSYVCAGLAFATAVLVDVEPPRFWASALTAAGLYVASWMSARSAAAVPAWVRVYFSSLGALLIAALLYGEADGGLLTVSWGLEGLALLGAGFTLRQRMFRLQGLGLLLTCILKLFLYDLRHLETIYRNLSFVVLGLILLGVSWIYSRFRQSVRRLL